MKKHKAKTGKLTVTLGCIAALSVAGLGGCGMADAGNKAESERQVTVAEIQGVYDPETEIQGTNVPETEIQRTNVLETESQKEEAETGIEPLPGKNDGLRKVTSENGGEAYFGSHTTVILDGETIDIKDRDDSVNAIYDIQAVDGYWIVHGHISPDVGYYGFYNTETRQWDKEFFGALLTWYGADEAEDGIPFSMDMPFSMDTVVYALWNGLYDGNGTLLGTIELDEDACEYIHKLKWASTGVEVYILNAALEEWMVMVDIGPILNNNSITIGDMSLSLSESKRDIIAKLETAGLNYSEHQPDSPDEVKYDSYYNVAEGCIQVYFLNDSCVRIRLINYESSPSLRVQTAQELRTLNTCTQMIELYGDDFETHTYSYKGIYTIYRYSTGDFIYEFGIPGEDAEKIYNIDIEAVNFSVSMEEKSFR